MLARAYEGEGCRGLANVRRAARDRCDPALDVGRLAAREDFEESRRRDLERQALLEDMHVLTAPIFSPRLDCWAIQPHASEMDPND